jgi:tRNA G18 (ribose-2'-O)-methylase SpoU
MVGRDLAHRLVPVGDADDPRVAPFRDIRERDLRGRHGLFVAEGAVVLRVLASVHGGPSGIRAEAILVMENRLEGIAELLAAFPPDVPVMVASRAVMDRIAGFPIHRGILAVGRREGARPLRELLAGLPASSLVLAASGISNHDNMGGLMRNSAAFGADAVVIDDLCCDPLYRKAIRVSVGAALTIPFARAGNATALMAGLGCAGFQTLALSPRGAVELADLRRGPKVAVLFGAEGPGLPDAVLAEAQGVRIVMAGGFDSLNVATTSGIVLHHLAAQRNRLA